MGHASHNVNCDLCGTLILIGKAASLGQALVRPSTRPTAKAVRLKRSADFHIETEIQNSAPPRWQCVMSKPATPRIQTDSREPGRAPNTSIVDRQQVSSRRAGVFTRSVYLL